MRAYDISLFALCLAAAIALLGPTGMFGAGPGGIELAYVYVISAATATLAAGGVSILGFQFKQTASLIAFGAMYAGSSAAMITLLWQFLAFEGAGTVVGVMTMILIFIGAWGALQVAKGPMGPEE